LNPPVKAGHEDEKNELKIDSRDGNIQDISIFCHDVTIVPITQSAKKEITA
jgi:hypothetical protein